MDLYLHFIPRYAGHWREIGALLGLSRYVLDTIEHDYGPRTIPCFNAMLNKWLQIDATASWRKLFTVTESPAMAGRAPDKGMYSSCI